MLRKTLYVVFQHKTTSFLSSLSAKQHCSSLVFYLFFTLIITSVIIVKLSPSSSLNANHILIVMQILFCMFKMSLRSLIVMSSTISVLNLDTQNKQRTVFCSSRSDNIEKQRSKVRCFVSFISSNVCSQRFKVK